jgi:hypothetical protein
MPKTTAKHSPLPWGSDVEQCAANHTVTDSDGVPVLQLNAVSLKRHGADRVRDANERLVLTSVNNVKRLTHILKTIVRVVPGDMPGLPSDLIETAKETLKTIEKEIGST